MLISLGLNDVSQKSENGALGSLTIQSFLKEYVFLDREVLVSSANNTDDLMGIFALFGVSSKTLYAYPVHIPLICALAFGGLASFVDESLKLISREYGRACASVAVSIYQAYKTSNVVFFGINHVRLTMQKEFQTLSLEQLLSVVDVSNTSISACRDTFFSVVSPLQNAIKNTHNICAQALLQIECGIHVSAASVP
jgi:hypothetical protein